MKRLAGKVVYLAGPMSGLPFVNVAAFEAAEQVLALAEKPPKAIINPARHPQGLENSHYYELGCIDARNADVVVLLEGWRTSRGVLMELSTRKPVCRHLHAASVVYGLIEVKREEVEKALASIDARELTEMGAVELASLDMAGLEVIR